MGVGGCVVVSVCMTVYQQGLELCSHRGLRCRIERSTIFNFNEYEIKGMRSRRPIAPRCDQNSTNQKQMIF
jgi:hypothetical protein